MSLVANPSISRLSVVCNVVALYLEGSTFWQYFCTI